MQDRLLEIASRLPVLMQTHKRPYFGMLEEAIRSQTPADARILEIGPGAMPAFRKRDFKNLKLLDFYSTDELFEHFTKDFNMPMPPDKIEPVDYPCKDGNIRKAIGHDVYFDLVFSSHNIEHQPDLLRHLNHLESILAPDGAVIFLVPDKRCTLDFFRPLSDTGAVLQANYTDRKNPTPTNMFSWYAGSLNFNPARPVAPTDKFDFSFDLDTAYLKFLDSFGDGHEYTDIHSWTFTPESMNIILIELFMLRKTRLFSVFTSDTYGNEFMIMLKKIDKASAREIPADTKQFLHEKRWNYYKAQAFGGGSAIY